ncbi:MBL fold metallo-hydrolase [Sphingobacterium sp. UBA5670]|uniref:MBL fold metallo-hydrolase n=1 Tax=Sphingobacterium sp. UBA5670 TaxID=1947502 RepID=UPI0025D01405|nr:MBL fold metallo-hydrolase [Sphingobacterium sp. UBA5670]
MKNNIQLSDHFNGRKFFNPTLEKQISPGISDVIKMMREEREKWPKYVEDCGIPNLNEKLGEDDVAITFVNHATFLIQFQNINILTDPVWANCASPVQWFGPKRVRPCGVALNDLPKIDLILLSHNHYDHLDVDTLKILNERFSPKVFAALGDKKLLNRIGFSDVEEFDWWDSIKISRNTEITFAPTQHSSGRSLFDRDKSLWGSYYIQHENRSIYFGGDSGYSTHYKEISKRLGSPEFALLGIGSYAPNWFMKAIHTNPGEAVTAYQDLGAKLGIGMHYGTFQLSSEGYDQPQRDLQTALEERGLSKDHFITLPEGETRFFLGTEL